MGNKSSSSSNGRSWRQSSMPSQSNSASGWQHDYGQSSVSQYSQNYPVQHPSPGGYPPQDHSYAPQGYAAPPQSRPQPKLDRRYSRIADNYNSLEEVCVWIY